MSTVNFETAGFEAFLKKPLEKFEIDLSNSNVMDVIQQYITFKKKSNPNYDIGGLVYNLNKIQKNFGIVLNPLQIIDDFYVHFFAFLINQGLTPSTIKNYFDSLRAVFNWGIRHNLKVSSTFDQFKVPKYSKTKVALTPDEVSLIAHFDIRKAYELKDEEFIDKAKSMLDDDINKEIKKRNEKSEKLIERAKKCYNTSINNAEKLKKERLSKNKISELKKNKIEALYIADIKKAEAILDTKIKEAKKLQKSLTESEIDKLLQVRLEHLKNKAAATRNIKIETLEKVRDQFVLQCSLGQRYSDICRIDKSCFSDDKRIFSITQQKTGTKAVVDIPTYAFDKRVVYEILEKYDYCSPYPRDISNFNRGLHRLLQKIGQNFNDIIKSENKIRGEIIINEIPKWKAISSHTARRSFATYNIARGFSEAKVRRCTGHTDSRSFCKYIIWENDD